MSPVIKERFLTRKHLRFEVDFCEYKLWPGSINDLIFVFKNQEKELGELGD